MTKPRLFLSYAAVTFPLLFNSHLCSPFLFQLYLDASFLPALSFIFSFYVETEVLITSPVQRCLHMGIDRSNKQELRLI